VRETGCSTCRTPELGLKPRKAYTVDESFFDDFKK
jgi:hypothetical protein